ncbi:uncharacterized protein LOC142234289 [Haematobia irritans]|uniref:uncharacterized protein LOC142234289 n=1 Tax=Haematobia irritans TaxID=7368 RepID=UPI003F4F7FCC
MNGFVHHNLPPPPQLEECANRDLQGILEIEVSHIILGEKQRRIFSSLPQEKAKECSETENLYDTPPPPSPLSSPSPAEIILLNNIDTRNVVVGSAKEFHHKNLNANKFNAENCRNSCATKIENNNILNSSCVQVKIVWFGEKSEDAANVFVSCVSTSTSSPLKTKKYPQHFRKKKYKHCQSFVVVSTAVNNKLRYRICTCGALFLDYLRSCKPIQIIVSGNNSNNGSLPTGTVLGQAQLLPSVLLKKFSLNIAKGYNNFEHKTKIYTLYKRKQTSSSSSSTAATTYLPLRGDSVKSGEIQLRFKMMFAPAATSDIRVHDTQSWCPSEKHIHHHHHHHHHHSHMVVSGKSKVAEHVHVVQGDKSNRLLAQTKSEEIVEAMKKLDAKLVAYLAGETDMASKHLVNCEEENEVNFNLEQNDNNNNNFGIRMDDLSPATKLNIFKSIKGIKLEMEALTLQTEGTKTMDLMQNEIRPIFTVECQLSNELIRKVPRHDMFHLMQFESEKFHSLTQCTRFGQEDERSVKLDLDENANEIDEINLGRLYFTVWWREPGTCLNEMLGMGVLELSDLYNASLLEQCKRIEIQRRDRHLACLYFKITLQRDLTALNQETNGRIKRELFLPKQSSCDSGDEKSPASQTTDKQKTTSDAAQTSAQSNLTNDKISEEKACAQNNNTNKLQIAKNNFDDETTKIRLLKGFIYANEVRNMENDVGTQKILICRRFWLDEPAAAKADETNKFNYQEQFSVINDEKFLQRVEKQFLHLELWHRVSSDDGNGNNDQKLVPVGLVLIPLHQFFIAYRDAAITNHLCKGKLPVISIDSWAPIVNWQTGDRIGELKCLLAVGSEEQINNLKANRGLSPEILNTEATLLLEKDILHNLQPLQIATTSKNSPNLTMASVQSCSAKASKIKKTADLLDMLQKVLVTPSQQTSSPVLPQPSGPEGKAAEISSPTHNSTALKPLLASNLNLFKFALEIQRAIGLPLNPASKSKKGSKQRNASKRFPPNEPPSTYVTFQAEEGPYPLYKSHEGMVFATNIVEKSSQPQWQQRFRLSATVDYLNNPQKRFILKLWKKSALHMMQGRNEPTPMEDAIIGFAALDLTVFTKGLHIAGRFNIVDFNGRINGQLEIRCHPLEEIPISAGIQNPLPSPSTRPQTTPAIVTNEGPAPSVDAVIDQFEQTLDLTHLNLGQAIKRKFTELEGISQRLRARLGDVTGIEIPKTFNIDQLDSWQPLSADINDNDFEEFENDLNTPPAEEQEKEDDEKTQTQQEINKLDDKVSQKSLGCEAVDKESSSE